MYEDIREEVYRANVALPQHQLVILTWGNVSCIDREKGIIAIKPSGVPYASLRPEDIVIMDMEGKLLDGTYRPSSDFMTHLCLYKAFETMTSIVHTHSKWATIWAQAYRDIPVYGTTHADYFCGNIPCTKPMSNAQIQTDYEWNTGMQIIDTINQRNLKTEEMNAVLVGGHGPFVWGSSCDKAIEHARVLEVVAEMAYYREQLNHDGCNPIAKELLYRHYFRKHGKDAYYGQ